MSRSAARGPPCPIEALLARTSSSSKARQIPAVFRPRVPVSGPSGNSTWEDEFWKLQRLYSVAGPFSSDDAKGEEGTCVSLVHQCTDPDWEAATWAPAGISIVITVPAAYPNKMTPLPVLRLSGPESLPETFRELVPLLFKESVAHACPHSQAVYNALRHVDRHLVALWRKVQAAPKRKEVASAGAVALAEAEADAQGTEEGTAKSNLEAKTDLVPWTPEEQARLEEALVEFRGEADTKLRWAAISKHVGGSRSARDCADRFRVCRDAALSKEVAGKQAEQGPEQRAWSTEDVRRMGFEVRLLGANLEGIATLLPSKLRLQVVCGRCKKPTDLETSGKGADAQSTEVPCPVCKQQIGLRVAPAICHGGCTAVAHVLGMSCHPVQFLRSDFAVSCGECTQTAQVNSVGPGFKKRSNCAGCHAKHNLTIEGVDLLGNGVAQWQQIAAEQGEQMNGRRQLQEARKAEKDMGIKVGLPLPDQGSCKHFRKSYRWMRFPCCGRAFPCGDCHDEAMDHVHQWATRMLCGSCSFEQPFSNDKCTHCGAASTRSRSAYWEGGQGCRNRATMATDDNHKFKGLGKTTSRKKAAK